MVNQGSHWARSMETQQCEFLKIICIGTKLALEHHDENYNFESNFDFCTFYSVFLVHPFCWLQLLALWQNQNAATSSILGCAPMEQQIHRVSTVH